MEHTLSELCDEVIEGLPWWRRRIVKRRRRRNPEAFYGFVAEQLGRSDSPCKTLAQLKFGEAAEGTSLGAVSLDLDPETLEAIKDFIRFILTEVLPVILALFGLSLLMFMLGLVVN